eukprot:Gregarina_sp_Poly_1__3686@NODE_2088_length_2704_cov_26_895715_g1348_i0_p2_GENE_NODE_2088_length_2704_cov_26_895715_g1348_i0NODE_2088_length_2704_cov_26_895715_g1348_i0_p2_ORF_typecomplete_len100_score10_49Presenilin/PF01080_17/0_21_NODE_2088_length_2704_cov_26_895715_g1348_i0546845
MAQINSFQTKIILWSEFFPTNKIDIHLQGQQLLQIFFWVVLAVIVNPIFCPDFPYIHCWVFCAPFIFSRKFFGCLWVSPQELKYEIPECYACPKVLFSI